jgi:DNA-binding SARP family transcriptional activator
MAFRLLLDQVDDTVPHGANGSLMAGLPGGNREVVASPAASGGRMDFRILGTTEVLDGSRLVPLPSGRGRALLVLLLLHAGEAVATDRIIDELWGEEPPRTATTVVQGLVSRLRKALEPDQAATAGIIRTVEGAYRLSVDRASIDADRFRRLLDEARDAPPAARAATLSAALGLWRGPALSDFRYEPFAQRSIAALEEMRIEAIEGRIEADLAIGRAGELVAELKAMVAACPLRERLRGSLMLALYRTGRQAEALEAYQQARSTLVEELGLEPGPALRELESRILRQDPALEVSSPPPVAGPAERPGSAWLPRERRTVTVAVVDVAPRAEPDLDPEAVGRAGERAARAAGVVLAAHGGRVERLFGDTVIAFFGFPRAREDDALRAVRAGLDARSAVHRLDDEASRGDGIENLVRIGLETGDIVVAGPGAAPHDVVTGTVVGAAGRLQRRADYDDVVIGPAAAKLLRGTAILAPIDHESGERPNAWRVLELVAGAPAVPRALGAPMVGRESELSWLRSRFRRAARSGEVVRATVLGDAGIGKSRLANELVASIGSDAEAITLRCPADGERTFFPLREAIVEAAGTWDWRSLHDLLARGEPGERALEQIADAMGLPAEPENATVLFPATRRLVEELAAERPLIVTFDDLHRAEPTVLDLVDHLADRTSAPVLLLCLARPELVELHPERDEQDRLSLEPLAAEDVERLVTERAGSIAPAALRRIIDVSQGNPLFAEQALAAIDDDGSEDQIPGSLRGLLTMRLDRLGPGERDVLRSGSIAGMEVPPGAIVALLEDDAAPFVDRHLDTLERKRLIQRDGADGFRFGHALIRMAAYQSLTRQDRAELHERFATWLESSRDTPGGLDAILGHHRTRADEHRRAAGTPTS